MGQISTTYGQSLILTAVDRLQSINAGAGMAVTAANVILLGEDAGRNITGSRLILLGKGAGKNSTLSDLVVIGENSVDNGLVLALATKSIVLGNNSVRGWTSAGSGAPSYPVIAIGHDIATNRVPMYGSVFIGNNILTNIPAGVGTDTSGGNVIIGQGAASMVVTAGSNVSYAGNVVIGFLAGSQSAVDGNNRNYNSNTVIGFQAGNSDVNNRSYQSNIVIGGNAGSAPNGITCDNNILVGNATQVQSAASTFTTQFNVVLGHAIQLTGNRNVYIGQGIVGPLGPASSPDYNIIMGGAGVGAQAFSVNLHNATILGAETAAAGLNYASSAAPYDFFVGNGNISKMLMYGNINNGNFMFGNNIANRVIGGAAVNCLSLTNGVKGNSPVGGGYFYALAGALHWVGSAGTDTVVAPA